MPKIDYNPTQDNLIVRRDAKQGEKLTSGGIIQPGSAAKEPVTGVVVATGPGVYCSNGTLIPVSINAGDRVVFDNVAPLVPNPDEPDILIMRESDIRSKFTIKENI